jgi:prophage antirepressor-like protein
MESTKSNALQVFDFEGKKIRIVVVDGEPWFVAKDVCDILELSDVSMSLAKLDDDEKGTNKICTPGGMQDMSVITESGLYTLIMRSNKSEAKKFRKWVTSVILPTIRKTGQYTTLIKTSDNEAALKRAEAQLRNSEARLNDSRVRLAKCIQEMIKDFSDVLSSQSRQAIAAYIADTVTGQPGLIPLPVIERTYTASELGEQFGISANMIGRIANRNGLKTPEYGFEVLDKARGHDKQVPSFRYNENGRERLAHIILDGSAPEEGVVA